MARPQEIDKKEILQKARELIALDGIEGFSMRKLAQKCDIATSTIYLHFECKLTIAIAITSLFWEEVFDNIRIDDCDDFFSAIKKLYFAVLGNLSHFKINFLTMFSSFNQREKAVAKAEMSNYMKKILSIIESQMQKFSKDLSNDLTTNFSRGDFAMFIYSNFESMLMRHTSDYSFFEMILRKLLDDKF